MNVRRLQKEDKHKLLDILMSLKTFSERQNKYVELSPYCSVVNADYQSLYLHDAGWNKTLNPDVYLHLADVEALNW